MKPIVTWALIADTRSAKVIENRGPGKGLQPVTANVWEAAAARPYSSEAGIGHSIAGPGRTAVDQGDPQENANVQFARNIVRALGLAHEDKSFDRLILVAGPHMLGLLRKAMSDSLNEVVVAELAKDLTDVPLKDLERHLGEAIAV